MNPPCLGSALGCACAINESGSKIESQGSISAKRFLKFVESDLGSVASNVVPWTGSAKALVSAEGRPREDRNSDEGIHDIQVGVGS